VHVWLLATCTTGSFDLTLSLPKAESGVDLLKCSLEFKDGLILILLSAWLDIGNMWRGSKQRTCKCHFAAPEQIHFDGTFLLGTIITVREYCATV